MFVTVKKTAYNGCWVGGIFAIAFVLHQAPGEHAVKTEKAKLRGTWLVVALEWGTNERPKADVAASKMRWTFEDEKLKISASSEDGTVGQDTGSYKIDP